MKIRNLNAKQTLSEVRQQFESRNENFYQKAVDSAIYYKFDGAQLQVLECLAGIKNPTRDLLSSNIFARQHMAEFIYRRLRQIRIARPNVEIAHVTIFDTAWETSDERTVVDLVGMKAAARPVLKALAPNFLAVGEIQAFTNVRHPDGGVVLTLHLHALGWGEEIKEAAGNAVAASQSRFRARFPGVDPIRLQWVKATNSDLRRVVQYPWKLSDRCKTHYQNDAKQPTVSNLHESEKGDRKIRYLRLEEIHSLIEIDRLVFGGGEGQSVRAAALRSTNQALGVARVNTPPIHPDEVPHFWVDAMAKPDLTRFRLPLIKYRKA